MNRSIWQRAKEIFDEARRLGPEQRTAFVEHRCEGNIDLRDQVTKLLENYDSDFLEETALGAADALARPCLKDGQVIGRYCIRELIGTGGMGQVFRADDTELDRSVAFKVLHRDVAEDSERVRRFIQEARAASALNHPNILTIHEIGSFEGARFIVSEYVLGETLRHRMRSGLTVSQSIDITRQITAALEAAHTAGIVHRDIKPENVMIRRDGLVKVLDFGLAKLTEADDVPIDANAPLVSRVHTSPGLVMGTVAYMSPEQARGQAVDARSDLWSLGVILHEMLTGRSPFESESATELITSIPGSDSSLPEIENLSSELTGICKKALTKEIGQRYQSAHDLLNDLKGEKKRMEYANQLTPYISVSTTDELRTQLIHPRPTLSAEYIVSSVKRHRYVTLAAVAAVASIAIGVSVYQFSGAPRSDQNNGDLAVIGPSTSEADLSISRIPSSGKIDDIAISPDGKQVAYVLADGSTKKSIRLLELETSRETELVPARSDARSDAGYEDLAFSPDGNHLYYVLFVGKKEDIYRIATRAGAPTKIIDGSVCGAGVSPDGKTLAFGLADDKSRILVTSNTDGLNQKVIAQSSSDAPDAFYCGGVPRWSPDGKEIACFADYTEKNEKFKKLVAISVADGSRRQLSDKRWADVDSAAYMPDGSLLVSAREKPAIEIGDRQLWLIARNSEPRRITTIPHQYSMLSATQKGDMVVARQSSQRRDLWVLSNNDVGNARQITTSGEIWGGGTWMPDGRILYGSSITGAGDIWTMDNDGANRKRLTINQGSNGWPVSTRDGKYILFHSNRTENRVHLFRADADGANVKQLTNGLGETRPRPSPDGKWVYYFQWNEKAPASIRRISIDGGDPVVMVTAAEKTNLRDLDISKHGRIAYEVEQRIFDENAFLAWNFLAWKRTIFIISADGKPITSFDLPKTAQGGFIRWTPDGTAIAFHDVGDKSGDIWTIPVKGKPIAKRLTTFRTPVTFSFDWTIDGKQLMVTRALTNEDAVIIRRNN